MRILGFSKKWDKLNQLEFTTFRFPRKDKDWQVGECVQVFLKPRSPKREKLGEAQIVGKEQRWIPNVILGNQSIDVISGDEARTDGFGGCFDMEKFMSEQYGESRIWREPMNKLTLQWK